MSYSELVNGLGSIHIGIIGTILGDIGIMEKKMETTTSSLAVAPNRHLAQFVRADTMLPYTLIFFLWVRPFQPSVKEEAFKKETTTTRRLVL